MPPPRESERWRVLIRRLADTFGADAFEPHVTLLGRIAGRRRDVIGRARDWAASTAPLTVRPRAIACLDEYYRCLFVDLEKTPLLLAARRRAEALFGHCGGDYRPHLSLLYGNFSAAVRRRAAAEISEPFDSSFMLRGAAVVEMDAAGRPAQWRTVASFSLPQPPPRDERRHCA